MVAVDSETIERRRQALENVLCTRHSEIMRSPRDDDGAADLQKMPVVARPDAFALAEILLKFG